MMEYTYGECCWPSVLLVLELVLLQGNRHYPEADGFWWLGRCFREKWTEHLRQLWVRDPTECPYTNHWTWRNCSCGTGDVERLTRYWMRIGTDITKGPGSTTWRWIAPIYFQTIVFYGWNFAYFWDIKTPRRSSVYAKFVDVRSFGWRGWVETFSRTLWRHVASCGARFVVLSWQSSSAQLGICTAVMDTTYSGMWIGREGHIAWSAWPLELNAKDFFFFRVRITEGGIFT